MRFCEKLDFLMKVTQTTNSTLSMYTSLDPSHISRLRRGQRSAAKNQSYVKSMAEYFARHCAEAYQRRVLSDALGIAPDACGGGELGGILFQWLTDERGAGAKTVDHFLGRLTSSTPPAGQDKAGLPQNVKTAFPDFETSVYYGLEGKRQAVLFFLSEVLAQSKPGALLLCSDEPTDWMTADPAFAVAWASLMSQVLEKGNRITIIHTVSRDLDEMLSAISQWMPLYMTGLIEPYYYPKKRDGVLKRTLFIAPEISAVVSGSVGDMINEAANFLCREKTAVTAFEREFNEYLKLCRPLMRIFTPINKAAYLDTLLEFEKEQSDSILKTESLSLLTMPETVASGIIRRIGNARFDLLGYHNNRIRFFEKTIGSQGFTEIICLAGPDTVKAGKVKVALSDMLSGGAVYYTAKEYILHLENLVALLRAHKNFHICLIPKEQENRYMVYVRDTLGAIVAKTSAPPIAMAINEDNMTAAFWDFLRNMVPKREYENPDNEAAARLLSSHIRQLKSTVL